MTVLIRAAATMASSGMSGRRLLILTYHRVLPANDPLLPDEVDAAAFDAQMAELAANWRVLPLVDAVSALRRGSLPPRAVALTFDDGYADNAEIALPILRKHGLTATFFVATGFLDGGRMWNDTIIEAVRRAEGGLRLSALGLADHAFAGASDRLRCIEELIGALKHLHPEQRAERVAAIADAAAAALPENMMMTSDQVRSLHQAGMEVGAHTESHPILSAVDATRAAHEINRSRARVQDICGTAPRAFAYPNGRPMRDYQREHVEMVRAAGFDVAVSTAWGRAEPGSDPFQLPRVAPWERAPAAFQRRLVAAYLQRQTQRA